MYTAVDRNQNKGTRYDQPAWGLGHKATLDSPFLFQPWNSASDCGCKGLLWEIMGILPNVTQSGLVWVPRVCAGCGPAVPPASRHLGFLVCFGLYRSGAGLEG